MEHLKQANASVASPAQIAKGLAVLTAVCAKPADFDDAKVVLWSERLKQVFAEFPGDIALAVIGGWPKTENGKWWPTENEVREECFNAMALRRCLQYELENAQQIASFQPSGPREPDDGMLCIAFGAAAEYVKEFTALDPVRAETYLKGARFDGVRIGIKEPLAALTLERAAPGLIAKHGVRIVAPKAFNAQGVAEWMP